MLTIIAMLCVSLNYNQPRVQLELRITTILIEMVGGHDNALPRPCWVYKQDSQEGEGSLEYHL